MGQRNSSLKHSVSQEFLFLHKKRRACFVFLFPWNSLSSSSTAVAWAGFLFYLWRSLRPAAVAGWNFWRRPTIDYFCLVSVCFFVSLSLRVLWFSPLLKNQLFQITIWPGIRKTKNHYVDVLTANRYLFIILFTYVRMIWLINRALFSSLVVISLSLISIRP